jgi:hypothetical protein
MEEGSCAGEERFPTANREKRNKKADEKKHEEFLT